MCPAISVSPCRVHVWWITHTIFCPAPQPWQSHLDSMTTTGFINTTPKSERLLWLSWGLPIIVPSTSDPGINLQSLFSVHDIHPGDTQAAEGRPGHIYICSIAHCWHVPIWAKRWSRVTAISLPTAVTGKWQELLLCELIFTSGNKCEVWCHLSYQKNLGRLNIEGKLLGSNILCYVFSITDGHGLKHSSL